MHMILVISFGSNVPSNKIYNFAFTTESCTAEDTIHIFVSENEKEMYMHQPFHFRFRQYGLPQEH